VGSFQKLASSSADARYTGAVDHETLVKAELVRQQQDARGTINRGIVMLAMIPLVILGAIGAAFAIGSTTGTVLALLGAVAYALLGGIGGIAMLASGAVEHRLITKQLREIDQPRQLPAARVIVR
jgi:hypothetical protein